MKKELTPRKRQALEMRAKIQSTALSLFNQEGFENVSVEEIAQAAGCSVGNIYHYFKSKDELAIQVTQMVDQAYTELEEAYRLSSGEFHFQLGAVPLEPQDHGGFDRMREIWEILRGAS